MEQPLGLQGSQFLLAAALGLLYGLHYDLLRGLRRNLRGLTHLLDAWFVLSCLLGNLCFALLVGNGEYRVFMLLGTAIGIFLWFFTLSRLFTRWSTTFWRVVTFPLRWFCRMCRKFLEFLKKSVKYLFSRARKSVTIRRQNSRSPQKKTSGGMYDAPVQIVTHYQARHTGGDAIRNRHHRHTSAKDQRAQSRKRNAQ
ncbi:MAG: spore cortex biosynthesis protein YabQ [Faecousia sp.]